MIRQRLPLPFYVYIVESYMSDMSVCVCVNVPLLSKFSFLMGYLDDYKPAMAMTALQFTYAGMAVSTRAALLQEMSPKVFVVYRQAIATLFIAPIAYFSGRKTSNSSLGMKNLFFMFVASLIGVTINQNIYFQGLYLASSTIASAMGSLVPAITFVMATFVGLEVVDIRSLRSFAKIVGTVICVGGAIAMSLLKGPKLLNIEFPMPTSALNSGGENWMLGCLLLFGSSCCWSFWLILQVPMLKSYPDHISLSAWMCFFATIQSATITFFLEPDPTTWKIHSIFELLCCFYSGIVGSGISFCIQAWCISRRGPLFSAMFSPLCTVIAAILACLFLHEELYAGSLAGSVAVVFGLYAVLWGKAKDLELIKRDSNSTDDQTKTVEVFIDESSEESSKTDLKEPLLAEILSDFDDSEIIN